MLYILYAIERQAVNFGGVGLKDEGICRDNGEDNTGR